MREHYREPSPDLALNSFERGNSLHNSAVAGQGAPVAARAGNPFVRAKTVQKRNTAIVIIPVLLVLVTFLFWYQTWFGRRLTAKEMGNYLSDTSAPHKTQHALSQLAQEMA